jgi:hypothetical protein
MKYNIKTVYLPLPETHGILRAVKNIQGVAVGVYMISCKCQTIYIPQLGNVTEECTKKLQMIYGCTIQNNQLWQNNEPTSHSNQLIPELQ